MTPAHASNGSSGRPTARLGFGAAGPEVGRSLLTGGAGLEALLGALQSAAVEAHVHFGRDDVRDLALEQPTQPPKQRHGGLAAEGWSSKSALVAPVAFTVIELVAGCMRGPHAVNL